LAKEKQQKNRIKKIAVTEELFGTIGKHKYFLQRHPKFSEAVFNKLHELQSGEFDSEKYINLLFSENLEIVI